tara:strand:+ start:2952 stop:4574 length:1623 start_codon:yes stop_codon:yes gene_type:complete
MPGGLLNLITRGEENVILNGNPQKTFFKNVFLKYTNFGMQKFRIDFIGQRTLQLTEPSVFSFKIPRHGDLLMDTYLSIKLPDIWSPLYAADSDDYKEYQFKWIENLGCEMIEEIEITAGGQTLQKMSGTYLNLLSHRDFAAKKPMFDYMTGHRTELNNPAYVYGRDGNYPNAVYKEEYGVAGAEPSIRGTTLNIPLNAWFTLNSQQAIPLVALQYSELTINIRLRPVRELFTINNITDESVYVNGFSGTETTFSRIQPNFNETYHQFYRFLSSPPVSQDEYTDKRTDWNTDIHLIANYAFLSQEENRVLVSKPQTYLIKDVYQSIHYDIVDTNMIDTMSSSLVTSWMFALRRSDAKFRNEWSNYTNWQYKSSPPSTLNLINLNYDATGFFVTPQATSENNREILLNAGILIDGKYRENLFDANVFGSQSNFMQSFANFLSIPYVYNYNFCLNTSPFILQPSGAINFSNFKNIQLELVTNTPPIDSASSFNIECDPETGAIISIQKPANSVYLYTYDLIFIEERYNIMTFANGMCGLKYAR